MLAVVDVVVVVFLFDPLGDPLGERLSAKANSRRRVVGVLPAPPLLLFELLLVTLNKLLFLLVALFCIASCDGADAEDVNVVFGAEGELLLTGDAVKCFLEDVANSVGGGGGGGGTGIAEAACLRCGASLSSLVTAFISLNGQLQ